MDGYWVWCGSVLEEEGKGFHLYAARWSKKLPMLPGYVFTSEIVHAFSECKTGPFHFVEKVLPCGDPERWDGRMAHNPTVCRWKDRYLMYYIASTYRGEIPRSAEEILARKTEFDAIYHGIRIGLAVADHPGGPWSAPDHPVLEVREGHWDSSIVTNPAPCVLPDGRIYLYYRSNIPGGLRIGLAAADHPYGPYRRVQDNPVMEDIYVEDPFVWHRSGHFEMLAKDMTGKLTGEFHSGVHFLSDDGISWRPAESPKAYSRTVRFDDGTTVRLGSLERPQLLLSEDGTPDCLYCAAADGPGGFDHASETWNLAVPLAF